MVSIGITEVGGCGSLCASQIYAKNMTLYLLVNRQ